MTATLKIIITILAMGSSISDGAAKIFFNGFAISQ
jgi:hypothetical protein